MHWSTQFVLFSIFDLFCRLKLLFWHKKNGMFILEIILTLNDLCTTLVLSKKLESMQKQTKTRNEAQFSCSQNASDCS